MMSIKEISLPVSFRPLYGVIYLLLAGASLSLLVSPYYQYAFLPSIIFLFMLILADKPSWGLYLIIFLFPFRTYTGIVEVFNFLTLSVQKFIGFYLLAVVLLLIVFKKRNSFQLSSPLWIWFVIYFVVSLISAVLSDYSLTSFSNLRALLTPYIIFFFCLALIPPDGYQKIVPGLIIWSVAFNVLISVGGQILHSPLLSTEEGSNFQRWAGAVGGPNVFSSMIVFALPFVVYSFFHTYSARKRTTYLLLFALYIIGLVLTYSRAGLIVFFITITFLVLQYIRRLRPRYLGLMLLPAILLTVITMAVIPDAYIKRFRNITNVEPDAPDTIGRRISYLVVAWETFKENPLIGSGPGTFKDIYGKTGYALEFMKEQKSTTNETGKQSDPSIRRVAHNTFIEVLTGTGIFGFAVFLLILASAFKNFFKAKKNCIAYQKKELIPLIDTYRIAFISLIVFFPFLSMFYNHYIWLSLGFSQLALNFSREEAQ